MRRLVGILYAAAVASIVGILVCCHDYGCAAFCFVYALFLGLDNLEIILGH